MRKGITAMLLATVAVAGCSGKRYELPEGAAAYGVIAPEVEAEAEYRIGALDQLNVTVLGEPDLSLEEVRVDASGHIAMPLLGQITARGLSPAELARAIERDLGARYLRRPQVAVNLVQSFSRNVAVEGSVRRAGIYPLGAGLTLQRAVALAEGTADQANAGDVVVVRTINGQLYAARFDLDAIRAGQAPDPALRPDDRVFVGESAGRRLIGTVIAALPAIAGVFIAVNQLSQ